MQVGIWIKLLRMLGTWEPTACTGQSRKAEGRIAKGLFIEGWTQAMLGTIQILTKEGNSQTRSGRRKMV
jgi:hypothetical protein